MKWPDLVDLGFLSCHSLSFMGIWMGLNVVQPFGIAFDKYPFILLNLVLSTLAAVQAPLIMMSQNRASDYDRLQARNDYHVNTQSKEEIRLLHEKIDHLVQQDQIRSSDNSKLQTEMIMGVSQQVEKMSDDIRALKEEKTRKGVSWERKKINLVVCNRDEWCR